MLLAGARVSRTGAWWRPGDRQAQRQNANKRASTGLAAWVAGAHMHTTQDRKLFRMSARSLAGLVEDDDGAQVMSQQDEALLVLL